MTEPTLSTQEAADRLNVSLEYLIGLLDRGEIPHHRTNADVRINLRDAIAYEEQSQERSRNALEELVAMDQEAGFYGRKP